jgi:hypothetical protein
VALSGSGSRRRSREGDLQVDGLGPGGPRARTRRTCSRSQDPPKCRKPASRASFRAVGAARFELATFRPPAERATKLRHAPEPASLRQFRPMIWRTYVRCWRIEPELHSRSDSEVLGRLRELPPSANRPAKRSHPGRTDLGMTAVGPEGSKRRRADGGNRTHAKTLEGSCATSTPRPRRHSIIGSLLASSGNAAAPSAGAFRSRS